MRIKKLIIGIDCFNISQGGGLTHLVSILNEFDKLIQDNLIVIVWGSKSLLKLLPTFKWLIKENKLLLNKNIFLRFFWHLFLLKNEIKRHNVNVLLCPGGICLQQKIPSINMFRNVLPFLDDELNRYSFYKKLRFKIFRSLTIYSFKKSSGIIYLSNWSKSFLNSKIKLDKSLFSVIPHGVNKSEITIYKNISDKIVKLLYVSHTSPYKNYNYVLRNIIEFSLKHKHKKVEFTSIGDLCDGFDLKKWNKNLPCNLSLNFLGKLDHKKTLNFIKNTDMCIFASSAENFPNVLLEYMSHGSICISNDIQPMKSILGKAGIFFKINKKFDLKRKIEYVLNNPKIQVDLKMLSYKKSLEYNWETTAKLTLDFCFKVFTTNFKNDRL